MLGDHTLHSGITPAKLEEPHAGDRPWLTVCKTSTLATALSLTPWENILIEKEKIILNKFKGIETATQISLSYAQHV